MQIHHIVLLILNHKLKFPNWPAHDFDASTALFRSQCKLDK